MKNTSNFITETITFRTAVQAEIFEHEIKGQMSDGFWENAPGNQWKVWCDTEVLVGEPAGRNFRVSKVNYNLTNADFLDILDVRMVNIGLATLAFGRGAYEHISRFFDIDGAWQGFPAGPQWEKERKTMYEFLDTKHLTMEQLRTIVHAQNYSRKQLIADLEEMKKAMRTLNSPPLPAAAQAVLAKHAAAEKEVDNSWVDLAEKGLGK